MLLPKKEKEKESGICQPLEGYKIKLVRAIGLTFSSRYWWPIVIESGLASLLQNQRSFRMRPIQPDFSCPIPKFCILWSDQDPSCCFVTLLPRPLIIRVFQASKSSGHPIPLLEHEPSPLLLPPPHTPTPTQFTLIHQNLSKNRKFSQKSRKKKQFVSLEMCIIDSKKILF